MVTVEQIKDCIERAKRHESKLSEEALMVPSLTSIKLRHLYNNLGSFANHYLDCGSHLGGSFCSTVYGNHDLSMATSIDNFSENFNTGDVMGGFLANAKKYTSPHTEWRQINKDCFTVTPEDMGMKVDLYLYDGAHDYESQKKAIIYFLPYLTDTFTLIVDDYAWEPVRSGTQDGIKEAGLEVLFETELVTPEGGQHNEHFHNNSYIALLKQRK